jgi:adenylate cyclase
LHAIMAGEPPRPSGRRPSLDPRWDAALRRAMAREPKDRFESVEAFVLAVDPDAPPADAPRAAGTFAPAAPPAAPRYPTPTPRTLAVLPFVNRSGDPGRDYFCAGITEDLLTDLARLPGLRVASPHAVARYAGPHDDIVRVASELRVSAVLEGDVRWAGQQVRITGRLLDGTDGFQIWAERYDRSLDDVFTVQDEIAHAIATAMKAALTPTLVAEFRRGRPREAEAYDAYLRGRELYRRYTPGENRQALECFEHAVQLDSGYALAWAGIADCCAQVCDKRWEADPAWAARGFAAARRAVELDPRLAEAHKAEALLWRSQRDHERAKAALLRALEADPRSIPALINLAHEHLGAGDLAAGERTLRRAVAVDPAYAFSHLMLAVVLLYTRRFEEAVRACDAALHEGASGFYVEYVYPMRAHALARLGRFDAAREEIGMGLAAGAPGPILGAARALVAALAGDRDDAARRLAELDAFAPRESYGCELAARAAGVLGEAAGCVRWLAAAEAIDDRHPVSWRLAAEFDAVRDSDEFTRHLGERGQRLVWPSEAPALGDPERGRFESVTSASGRSVG